VLRFILLFYTGRRAPERTGMAEIAADALVLVSVTPSERDLEIARVLGWYRIPLRFSPKVIDVDYLAFYQTSAFGSQHRWLIEKAAAVRGHELTTRAELLREEQDHPRAHEEYYKIQLGEMFALSHPVKAEKWKRLTFLYTTGEKLNSAKTLHDLPLRLEEREPYWRILRERSGDYANSHQQNAFDLESQLAFFNLSFLSGEDSFWDGLTPQKKNRV